MEAKDRAKKICDIYYSTSRKGEFIKKFNKVFGSDQSQGELMWEVCDIVVDRESAIEEDLRNSGFYGQI